MIENLSPTTINKVTNDVQEQYYRSNNHWWIKLINNRWWISLWIIIAILSFSFLIFSITAFRGSFFKNTIAIILLITFISSVFLLVQSFVLKSNFRLKTLANLPLIQYYQWALIDLNSQVNLENIVDDWDLAPQGNLPLNDSPTYYNYRENVILGTISQQRFNYGSILNQKVVYDHRQGYNYQGQVVDTSKSTSTYSRFVYYTTTINNKNNLTMTLTPRTFITKMFQHKNKARLESSVFEDLFEVNCDNEITLRLFLEPLVIDHLNNFAASLKAKNLPTIHLQNNQLTLSWKYDLGSNPHNNIGKIMSFPTNNNYDKFVNKLLTMISEDLFNLIQAQTWVKNLS